MLFYKILALILLTIIPVEVSRVKLPSGVWTGVFTVCVLIFSAIMQTMDIRSVKLLSVHDYVLEAWLLPAGICMLFMGVYFVIRYGKKVFN